MRGSSLLGAGISEVDDLRFSTVMEILEVGECKMRSERQSEG